MILKLLQWSLPYDLTYTTKSLTILLPVLFLERNADYQLPVLLVVTILDLVELSYTSFMLYPPSYILFHWCPLKHLEADFELPLFTKIAITKLLALPLHSDKPCWTEILSCKLSLFTARRS